MATLKIVLTVIFLIISIAMSIIVLMQEGKQSGLGAITGGETYWSKNKGRSKEAIIVKVTTVLGVLFLIISILLASKLFN